MIMLFSDDAIQEQAYLVSRGVRPLALVGTVEAGDEFEVMRTVQRLETVQVGDSLALMPIVMAVERYDDPLVDLGFASHSWVVDTFDWINRNVPAPHRDRMLGLMLGYSADAIAAFDASHSGQRFTRDISELGVQVSN